MQKSTFLIVIRSKKLVRISLQIVLMQPIPCCKNVMCKRLDISLLQQTVVSPEHITVIFCAVCHKHLKKDIRAKTNIQSLLLAEWKKSIVTNSISHYRTVSSG